MPLIFRACWNLRVVPRPHARLPELPIDVCDHIAGFLDPLGWGDGERGHETLLRVLLALSAYRETIAQKCRDHFELSRPFEEVVVGYESYGHGYGMLHSVYVLQATTFLVDDAAYAAKTNDTVRRCMATDDVLHNGVRLDNTSETRLFFRRGSVKKVHVETTPGW